jgi:hypothetical protein
MRVQMCISIHPLTRIAPNIARTRRAREENHMQPTSRRQFLKRSSAVAAAAGVAATVPASAAKALVAPPQKHEPDRRLPDDASVDVPVVAHVTDVRKGLVSLYTGEREITIKNRRLAAALYHATR